MVVVPKHRSLRTAVRITIEQRAGTEQARELFAGAQALYVCDCARTASEVASSPRGCWIAAQVAVATTRCTFAPCSQDMRRTVAGYSVGFIQSSFRSQEMNAVPHQGLMPELSLRTAVYR